ncbi:peptidylprolyl isomerase [Oleiharenicola lentus]|uniref:peptidylprolyl isomerase n=1 Tax=Oleiharenicola lentus TaxID=2508720 RepID=UPI003F67F955
MRLWKIALLAMLALTSSLFAAKDKLPNGLYAEFTTPHGVFTAELFYQKVPLTVANFVGLTEGTIGPKSGDSTQPYYTGLKWYRVVPGFVIQSGNPKAPEESEPGYSFSDEFAPGLNHHEIGTLSMANGGPDTNSAEFFVTLGDCTRLNYLHSVFGRTVRGVDVLPKIKANDAFSVKILRVGAAAKAFKADETTFKALSAKAPKYVGEKDPGPTAHFDDPDLLIPLQPPRAANFNYKLANFERTTGVRIVARLFSKSPTAEQDAVAGAFMKALATQLGTANQGALAVYFADEDDWRVWIGDKSTAAFFGKKARRADLGEGAAFHDVKEKFLAATRAEGDAAFEKQKAAAPADKPPLPAQRLKLQTDAVVDTLISILEPK